MTYFKWCKTHFKHTLSNMLCYFTLFCSLKMCLKIHLAYVLVQKFWWNWPHHRKEWKTKFKNVENLKPMSNFTNSAQGITCKKLGCFINNILENQQKRSSLFRFFVLYRVIEMESEAQEVNFKKRGRFVIDGSFETCIYQDVEYLDFFCIYRFSQKHISRIFRISWLSQKPFIAHAYRKSGYGIVNSLKALLPNYLELEDCCYS